jgi:hypothetical protein
MLTEIFDRIPNRGHNCIPKYLISHYPAGCVSNKNLNMTNLGLAGVSQQNRSYPRFVCVCVGGGGGGGGGGGATTR